MPERKGENTQFQHATILDAVYEEPYTAHLEKESGGWRGWIPQLPEVECTAETKKELLNTLAIRLREALQAREDAWDKQLEAHIEAGKLEHLREDARRAKKAGKRIDYPRANTKTS
jgi:predicted RNase H-like HicB family nuclease